MNLDWRDDTGPCREARILINDRLTICRLLSFAPLYAASEDGQIISFAREHPHALSASKNGANYNAVNIKINGRQQTIASHQLICFAFTGPRPSPNHLVRHLDGDKSNNAAYNLKWGTFAENRADKVAHAEARGETHQLYKSHSEAVKAAKLKARQERIQKITDLFSGQ